MTTESEETAEDRPQEAYRTGVQEFAPLSADKWESMEGFKKEVPNARCINVNAEANYVNSNWEEMTAPLQR